MSTEQNPSHSKPRSPISLPFLVAAGVLGAIAYFTVPWVMTQFMYLQEQDRAKKRAFIYEGQPPETPAEASGGQEGGGGRQGGGGGRDPEAMFARLDADSDGKIQGEEISERLKNRMEQIDTDKDGALSKEEFLAGMQTRNQDGGGNAGGATVPKARPARSGNAAAPSEAP